MKIAIVNQHISQALGGSEMQCDIIARELKNRGHDVIYITPNLAPIQEPEPPYPIVYMDTNPKKTLDTYRPEIIYWRHNKKGLYKTVRAAKKLKIPFVFAISSKQDPQFLGWRYQKKNTQIRSALNIIQQLASSAWNYIGLLQVDALTSLNGRYLRNTPVKNKHVVYNSVYTEQAEYKTIKKPYVMWTANLKSTKQPELFIDLARKMRNSDIRFIMIGKMDAAYKDIVMETVRNLPNFEYFGQASPFEVNSLLKDALCMVHTCKPEGFGNIFIQSWFQGCPTVSYSFDPDGFIRSRKLGFVSGNLNQLVKDVQKIRENPDLRQELSHRAYHTASKFFTKERLGDQLEALFLDLKRKG